MTYVNCARFPMEQNLVVVQFQGKIFYESCKEIYQNQELLVWYGDGYEKFLDIPVSLQVTEQGKQRCDPYEGEHPPLPVHRDLVEGVGSFPKPSLQSFSSQLLMHETKLQVSLTRGSSPS